MVADLVGPTPNLKRHFLAHAAHNVARHLQIVLTICYHHEVINVQLIGETMRTRSARQVQTAERPNPGCR